MIIKILLIKLFYFNFVEILLIMKEFRNREHYAGENYSI